MIAFVMCVCRIDATLYYRQSIAAGPPRFFHGP